jgi:pyrroline-5-carboxylate reductase
MTRNPVRLLVFGGGNMGAALVGGLVRSGWADVGEMCVVEPHEATRAALADKLPGVPVVASAADAPSALGVLVAVKPNDVAALGPAIAASGAHRVLSVAAGVTTAAMETAIGRTVAVVRSMPNTPSMVGMGAAAIAPGTHADEGDMDWAATILDSVGITVRVPEQQLDAVTGLSGSGPAYVFLFAEALIEAGVLNGLARPIAHRLAIQTLAGAAALLANGDEPAVLRGNVTSPGGTTAAGLRELERGAVRADILNAVSAATERSRALGA